MDEIINLRHELHRNPELSGNEKLTAKRIVQFLSNYKPDELYTDIAGSGVAAVYNGKEVGATLLFRCDMDALPVEEHNALPYKSMNNGVSHQCGHDGHMAMVSGLAKRLHENPIGKGRVVLFYQPEEENGKGAKESINELRELGLLTDFAFAIHNMPKYPFGSIVLGKYTFSAASKGVIIKLTGKNAHAAYPESGINPSEAVAEIIQVLNGVKYIKLFSEYILATIVHVQVGDVAFGTSPGYAEVMVTLRAFDKDHMRKLSDYAVSSTQNIAAKHKLEVDIQFTDEFPAADCNPELSNIVEVIAKKQSREVIFINQPNRWSEDFAHFTSALPSIIFGLGVGENHPDLHTNSYDFPDEIIPYGVELMEGIINHILR
ncbi:MAG: amidohydrolase [Bacteroidales bacterium]|nr:amidohydrolase [Bacteroidales bacterium]